MFHHLQVSLGISTTEEDIKLFTAPGESRKNNIQGEKPEQLAIMAFSRLYLPAAGKAQLGKQGCEINWYKEESGTASKSAQQEVHGL